MLTLDRHQNASQKRSQNRGEAHTVSRLEFDRTDPLRAASGALPTPHPASPIANSPIFSDPKVLETLLVDYLAGYTASRLCSSYNITLPQLFAWRRHPETRKLLDEHEEFAAAQARHVQHDKEPEIILTLCAIATRGTSESESRRAASDLLRAFKFREYLLQRGQRGSPTDQPPATEPPPQNKSRSTDATTRVRAPSLAHSYAPSAPNLRAKFPSPFNSNSNSTPTPNHAANPDPAGVPIRDPHQGPNQEPHQDPSQNQIEDQTPTPDSDNETALDTLTKFESLDHLASRPDPRPAESLFPCECAREECTRDECSTDECTIDEDPIEKDQNIDEDDQARLQALLAEDDHAEAEDEDRTDFPPPAKLDEPTRQSFPSRVQHASSCICPPPFPTGEVASRRLCGAMTEGVPELPTATPHATSHNLHIESEILTLPPEVRSSSPPVPDPAPGFPLCLTPKLTMLLPAFSEMARFMPPPTKTFNPYWPESDILYLCYPDRTDKHHLRTAIISHQEMLARSGAQALVDRHYFTPDQQSHEAYNAAVNFYQQLARKNPPPDH